MIQKHNSNYNDGFQAMVGTCSAYGCSNRASKKSDISCHHLPIYNKELCKQWTVALHREDIQPTSHSLVCSAHFISGDYSIQECKKPKLKNTAVPSVFNFPPHLGKSKRKRSSPKKHAVDTSVDTIEIGMEAIPAKRLKSDALQTVYPRKKINAEDQNTTTKIKMERIKNNIPRILGRKGGEKESS